MIKEASVWFLNRSMFNNKYPVVSDILKCCIFLLCLIHGKCLASFDVYDEDSAGYYGNAEKRNFKDDIEGSETLSPRDQAFLDSVHATRLTERWYMRALVGQAKTKVTDLHNTSSYSPPISNALSLTVNSQTNNLYQLLIAGGYLWEHWGLEAELFFTKQINLNMTPIFQGNIGCPGVNCNIGEQSTIKQGALLFNIQYVIPRYFDFYPQHLQLHLDAGIGPAFKMTNTKTYNFNGSPRQSGSANTIAGAGKLSAGARYQVTLHFLVDVAYYYLFLGKTNFGPVDSPSIKFKSDQTQSNGFFFGLTYQF